MHRSELAARTQAYLANLSGEQFASRRDEDGDIRFVTMWHGVPIGLCVETLTDDSDSVLVGHHVVGTRVEHLPAAMQFVVRQNQMLRFGRLEICGTDVVFWDYLFAEAVNKDAVRQLLRVLGDAARLHPDLAAAAGALRLSELPMMFDAT